MIVLKDNSLCTEAAPPQAPHKHFNRLSGHKSRCIHLITFFFFFPSAIRLLLQPMLLRQKSDSASEMQCFRAFLKVYRKNMWPHRDRAL